MTRVRSTWKGRQSERLYPSADPSGFVNWWECPRQRWLYNIQCFARDGHTISTMWWPCCCARDGFKISKEKETPRKIPMGVRSINDESPIYMTGVRSNTEDDSPICIWKDTWLKPMDASSRQHSFNRGGDPLPMRVRFNNDESPIYMTRVWSTWRESDLKDRVMFSITIEKCFLSTWRESDLNDESPI